VNRLAWLGASINAEHKYIFPARTGGKNHTFGQAELHLSGLEIGENKPQFCPSILRLVCRCYRSKDGFA